MYARKGEKRVNIVEKSISRPGFAGLLAAGAAALGVVGGISPAGAASKTHRIVFHVDQNDPAVMNLALNNMTNVATHYGGGGEQFELELVAYGPGLHMLRADTSPVKDRLASVKQSISDVTFSACNVTKTAMEKAEGHPIAIVPQARLVPAGVVRIVELEEVGWSYVKP